MATEFNYKILVCCECDEEFVFTASAQEYFASKGLKHAPKRCKFCHIASKRPSKASSSNTSEAGLGFCPG